MQETHQPADVTASELGSPDTEVGVDLLAQATQQSAYGGTRQKASLGALSSSQPASKGV